jgi:hypothetical protein
VQLAREKLAQLEGAEVISVKVSGSWTRRLSTAVSNTHTGVPTLCGVSKPRDTRVLAFSCLFNCCLKHTYWGPNSVWRVETKGHLCVGLFMSVDSWQTKLLDVELCKAQSMSVFFILKGCSNHRCQGAFIICVCTL